MEVQTCVSMGTRWTNQTFSKINQGRQQSAPNPAPSLTLWGIAGSESRSLLRSQLLLCPSGTSHWNLFRNPPRKQLLVGRRKQGRYRVGASHPWLAPWNPGGFQGMSRKTHRKGLKNSTSSPFSLRRHSWAPESGDQRPLSVTNTHDTKG